MHGFRQNRKKYFTIMNKNTIMQQENLLFSGPSILSVEYLLRFFETDSSSQILFEKNARLTFGYYIRPVAVFSQRHHLLMTCLALPYYSVLSENNTDKLRAYRVGIEVMEPVR